MKSICIYKQFHNSMTPEWLSRRKDVSLGAKMVYGRLARYAGKDCYCFPKKKTLADEVGISVRQLSRYINELIELKLIHVERKGLNRPNKYTFLEHKWMQGYFITDKTDMSHPDRTHMADQDKTHMADQDRTDVADPYIRESKEKNQSKRGGEKTKIPTTTEVREYFKSKGFSIELADKFYEYYNESMNERNGRVWKDGKGNTVKNWKQKAISVWMKDEHKIKTQKGETWNNTHKI